MKANGLAKRVFALSAAGVLFLTGCGGVNPNETAATVNGKNISAGLLNFTTQVEAVNYDTYYMPYYGTDMWTQDQGDGVTMASDVLDNIIVDVKQQFLLQEHMDEYGVTVSEQDEAAINAAVEEFFAENTANALNKMGASREIVKEYLRLALIEKRVRDAIRDTADTNVTDEEAQMRTFSYYKIMIPGGEDAEETDEETEKVELDALAATIATAAKEDFDSVADEFTQNLETQSYSADETYSFDEDVIKAADELSEGEVSDLIKTEDGDYYVIRLDSEFDEDATEERKEEIIQQRQNDKFNDVINEYESACQWTTNDKVIGKINFNTLYQMAYDAEPDTGETPATEEAQG